MASRARALLEPAVVVGQADAMALYAESFEAFARNDDDLTRAVFWYLKAAEAGRADAWYPAGELLLRGEGIERDVEFAFGVFVQGGDAGDADAAWRAGEMLRDGLVESPEPNAAAAWFLTAARDGRPEGFVEAGRLVGFGPEPERHCETAQQVLRWGLEADLLDAALLLGRLHAGEGACPADLDEAIDFYRIAERMRAPEGTFRLGRALLARSRQPDIAFDAAKDRREAVQYLALALQRGEADARPWLDWAIAGLDPPLGPDELADIRGLQILLDGAGYALPEGRPARPAEGG